MKKVISENDYDRYKVYVPLKFFMNGKRQKFLSSQLEKMHPCFSDNFCFDTKFGLSKKGVFANVIVMDKLRLGEYKANYPGLTLSCNEKGESAVFVDKKKRILVTVLCCIPLLAVLGCNILMETKKQSVDDVVEIVEQDSASHLEVDDDFAYENFFAAFDENGGKIESLNWKYDGFSEQLSVNLVNCYPEVFSDFYAKNVSFSDIAYKNDVPFFSVSILKHKKSSPVNQSQIDFPGKEDYRTSIRNLLRENSIKIVNENYLPFKVRFRISEKNVQDKILSRLNKVVSDYNLFVKEISLTMCDLGLVEMEITFSKDFSYYTENPILNFIETRWDDFAIKHSQKNSPAKSIKVIAAGGSNQKNISEKKLGTIIHADGEKVEFYKTVKGVIRNE